MAPKGMNRAFVQASQPAPAANSKPIQSYYSVQVLAEMIDANGGSNNALQVTFADAKSLRMGQPQRHPLTVLQKDGVAAMQLPSCPRGVTVGLQSMLGPNTQDNITNGASWVWTVVSLANTAEKKVAAVEYGVRLLCSVLDQGFVKANVSIPASDTHGPIQVSSRSVGERIEVTRSFGKVGGGSLTVKEIVNIHVAVGKNVPPKAKKLWSAYMAKQGNFITTSTSEPKATMKDTLPSHGQSGATNNIARAAAGSSVMKVRRTIAKRPARR